MLLLVGGSCCWLLPGVGGVVAISGETLASKAIAPIPGVRVVRADVVRAQIFFSLVLEELEVDVAARSDLPGHGPAWPAADWSADWTPLDNDVSTREGVITPGPPLALTPPAMWLSLTGTST